MPVNKTFYDAKKGDKFLVYDANNNLLRGIMSVDLDKNIAMQVYVHTATVKNHKEARVARRLIEGKFRVELHPSKNKRWDFLINKIKSNNYKIGAEIGLARGRTSFSLVRACKDLNLICVDCWPGGFEKMKSHWKRSRAGMSESTKNRIRLIEQNSIDAADEIDDNSLDFVFIDADHEYESVVADITAWQGKVRDGGMICGHDINWDTVKRAVDDCFGKGKYDVWQYDNVWYLFKGNKQSNDIHLSESDKSNFDTDITGDIGDKEFTEKGTRNGI